MRKRYSARTRVEGRVKPSPIPSVAQFGSARALGAWGRRFESCHSDQLRRSSSVVERLTHNQEVVGSNPTSATSFCRYVRRSRRISVKADLLIPLREVV